MPSQSVHALRGLHRSWQTVFLFFEGRPTVVRPNTQLLVDMLLIVSHQQNGPSHRKRDGNPNQNVSGVFIIPNNTISTARQTLNLCHPSRTSWLRCHRHVELLQSFHLSSHLIFLDAHELRFMPSKKAPGASSRFPINARIPMLSFNFLWVLVDLNLQNCSF